MFPNLRISEFATLLPEYGYLVKEKYKNLKSHQHPNKAQLCSFLVQT
jgi:hypothetical protein